MNLKHIALISIITTALISNESYSMDGKVHILTAANTGDFIAANKFTLIYGFAPNCNSCKNVDSFIQDLASELEFILKIKVGKINITNNVEVQKILRAPFLPYFGFFINGVQKQYEGDLKQTSITKWIKSIIGVVPRIGTIQTKAEHDKFLSNYFAVGLKYPETDFQAYEVLEAFAKIYPTIKFFQITGEAANEYKAKYELVLVRDFDEGNKNLSNNSLFDVNIIQPFLDVFKRPIVVKLDESVTNELYHTRRPTIIVFDKNYDTPAIKNLQKIALQYRAKLFFVMSNLEEAGSNLISDLFDPKVEDLPLIGAMDSNKGQLRKFRGTDCSESGMKNFIDSYLADKLEEFIKAEPIPTYQGAVKKVVRDNFDKIVKDKSNHVLVGFYSESCSYCKELHEAFDKAQSELRSSETDIVFAKFNLDKNDIDAKIEIKGLPAIFLYKKNNKENPIEFPLIRDWEVILEWLEEQLDRKNIYSKPMPEHLKKDLPKDGTILDDDIIQRVEEL